MTPRLSIVIPNWNGEAFLSRCLGGTLQSAQTSGESYEILVLDDASTDGSPDLVARHFPRIRLIRNARNQGFGATVNQGANEASGEFLLLLNNDLVPRETMIGELVAPLLADSQVFGVTGKALEWDGTSPNHLSMTAHWAGGEFRLDYADPATAVPTMFLLGGCCAVRRDEFLRLGGFCHLFAPGYWEDYDLSYLALKAGWKNVYTPLAQAYHFGQGSMKRAFGEERLNVIRERNAFLFTWLNVTDPEMLRGHAWLLPRLSARALSSREEGARTRARALFQAVGRLDAVAAERRRRQHFLRRTDREILAEFSQPASDKLQLSPAAG